MAAITDLKTQTHLRALGSLWQKDGMSRVYFNELPALLGLQCTYSKSSHQIRTATLHGTTISNSQARKMVDRLSGTLWFDEADGHFYGHGLQQADINALVAAILAQLDQE